MPLNCPLPYLWWASKAGSTLLYPVGNAGKVCQGIMALMTRPGKMAVKFEVLIEYVIQNITGKKPDLLKN